MLVSFPEHIFVPTRKKWVWSTAYSVFVQVARMLAHCSFLMIDVIKDTMCQQYASNMDVDWAITVSILEVQNYVVWE